METDHLRVIHMPRSFVRAWCEGCEAEVSMVTAEQAAAIAGISLRVLCRSVAVGALHFIEIADRVLFICPNSLNALTANHY